MYWVHLSSFFVHIVPLNYQLIGRKASVKIKIFIAAYLVAMLLDNDVS